MSLVDRSTQQVTFFSQSHQKYLRNGIIWCVCPNDIKLIVIEEQSMRGEAVFVIANGEDGGHKLTIEYIVLDDLHLVECIGEWLFFVGNVRDNPQLFAKYFDIFWPNICR